jgi:bifunctional non-homologous end joining protein LigD
VAQASQTKVLVEGKELTLSNLDKVLFPDSGFTKGQMIDYYVSVAPAMLRHIGDRPITLKRYPNGVAQTSFFEKHVPSHAPSWVRTVKVPSTADGLDVVYGVIGDLPTLVWAANLASIEFHVPLWRIGHRKKLPGPPQFMVFDLDPGEGASMVECCLVAAQIAELLEDRRQQGFPKTSGSKGLQIYVPLEKRRTWDAVRNEAHQIALELEQRLPALVISNMRRSLRPNKVLIDWSQNHSAKTTVAAYSLRGRPEPTASTPVTWQEVSTCAETKDPATLRFVADQTVTRLIEHGDLFVPADSQ